MKYLHPRTRNPMMSSPMPAGPKCTLSPPFWCVLVTPVPWSSVLSLSAPWVLTVMAGVSSVSGLVPCLVSSVVLVPVPEPLLVPLLSVLWPGPGQSGPSRSIIIVPVQVLWRESVTRFRMEEIFYTFSVMIAECREWFSCCVTSQTIPGLWQCFKSINYYVVITNFIIIVSNIIYWIISLHFK